MRALLLTGVERVEVGEVPDPEPGERALVAVERAGVCGTDLSVLAGHPPVDYPRILGHELVGRVVRQGRTGQVAEGTRVVVDPAVSCGRCHVCRMDRANLCPNGALLGRDVDGGFATYVAVDERQLLPIPPEMSLEDAALVQVLGVCVHAQRRIEVFPGQVAAVVGLGAGGLLHTQLLRARGADVIGITRSAGKRALAERLGAMASCPPAEAEACVRAATGGRGADIVVESAGTTDALAQSIRLAGAGGTVLQYGTIAADEGRLPFYELYHKEIAQVNSRAALMRDYATAVDLVASGRVVVAPLLSARYPLDQGAAALRELSGPTDLVKVVLDVG